MSLVAKEKSIKWTKDTGRKHLAEKDFDSHIAMKGKHDEYHNKNHLSNELKPFCPCSGSCPKCKEQQKNINPIKHFQPKLKIGAPDDHPEREADAIAQQIIAMSYDYSTISNHDNEITESPNTVNPKYDNEVVRKLIATQPKISRKNISTDMKADSIIDNVINNNGKRLDISTRKIMESAFGYDFGEVKIHTNRDAAESAHKVNAHAYTIEKNIIFGEGEYRPDTLDGRKLLAHELAHVVQQNPDWGNDNLYSGKTRRNKAHRMLKSASLGDPIIQRQPIEEAKTTFNYTIEKAKKEAAVKFPSMAANISQIALQATVYQDRTEVSVMGYPNAMYPTVIVKADEGFYLYLFNDNGDPEKIYDLSTGDLIFDSNARLRTKILLVHQIAGVEELKKLRANRIGIFWITKTVTQPPSPSSDPPNPDDIEFPLTSDLEITEEEFKREFENLGQRNLVILGTTGGTFYADELYSHPLNFKYHTQDGIFALVSRLLVGRQFYYRAPIDYIQNFLRFYPIEYAGKSAAAWEPLARLMFDVGVSFIPIIGPLYGLAMAGQAAYHAYHNWDKMSGWEKGLVGVTVLLSVVPAIRTTVRITQGAAKFAKGVDSLTKAGMTLKDARRLMITAGIFQSERAALRIVDTLGDALRRGENLTLAELNQLKGVFNLMLQRIPVAERLAITAGFATRDLEAATQFFVGVELTERHLVGLRRLAPEVLVALKTAAREEPIIVERIALWASHSEDIALGINRLEGVVRPAHLPYLITEAGSDILAQLNRANINITPELMSFARAGKSARDAYRRLMQGINQGGRNIPGLVQLLARTYPKNLPESLLSIGQQFSKTFLTATQLSGLALLTNISRDALRGASDSQLRLIASIVAESPNAARAIDLLSDQLAPVLRRSEFFPYMMSRLGGGILKSAGTESIVLNKALLDRIALQSTSGSAYAILINGFNRAGVHTRGLLDEIAGRLTTLTATEKVLESIEIQAIRANLFARWAIANPAAIRNVSADLSDSVALITRLFPENAALKMEGIYRAFSANHKTALSVFESIGRIERIYGKNLNLESLISELAAGSEKTMGASLTLNYVTARSVGAISAFEHAIQVGARSRVYDLFAGGIYYEFKYWLQFSGRPAVAAADEFARDLIIHIDTSFSKLRWVINKDASSALPAIESMMRGVISRPEVQAILRSKGITFNEATRRIDQALNRGMIEFF
jgi:Domain of unknown function (DUF4157)